MTNIGAILLAGGLSSRMGQDKAALTIAGQTLLERLVRIVSPLVNRSVVMLSASQKLPDIAPELLDYFVIGRDSRPEEGPLQGISDALPLFGTEVERLFVLSCDLPYLNTQVLDDLRLLLTPAVDGVCAEVGGRVNPLLAVYFRQFLVDAVQPSAAGRSCMILVDDHPIARMQPPDDDLLVFDGINTPDGYAKAKRLLESPESP